MHNGATAHRLRVENLTRRFGGVTAVNNLSFTLEPGQFIAVVGPNGAGKTTLLQLITGVDRPDSGRLWLGEKELTGKPPEAIAAHGVARTFQTSRVFPGLTIWDSVRMGGHLRLIGGGRHGKRLSPWREFAHALWPGRAYANRQKDVDDKAQHVLQLFGDRLWPRRFQPAYSLSYANRRRLELARTLMDDPLVLLLDEPAAGMNPTETNELTELIARLRESRPHMSIILVEHKLDMVRRLARRVLVMNYGARVVEDTPEQALQHPQVIEAYLGAGRSAHEKEEQTTYVGH